MGRNLHPSAQGQAVQVVLAFEPGVDALDSRPLPVQGFSTHRCLSDRVRCHEPLVRWVGLDDGDGVVVLPDCPDQLAGTVGCTGPPPRTAGRSKQRPYQARGGI
jgi:hypothetical protein